jgi:hypothetical protein
MLLLLPFFAIVILLFAGAQLFIWLLGLLGIR